MAKFLKINREMANLETLRQTTKITPGSRMSGKG